MCLGATQYHSYRSVNSDKHQAAGSNLVQVTLDENHKSDSSQGPGIN